MKNLKLILLAVIIFISASTYAQTFKISPFHRLPNPDKFAKAFYGTVAPVSYITAWRFTAAAAGFDIINNKVLTGIGYGYNTMHAKKDSSGNAFWYTDFTANISVYAAGNVAPAYS